MYIQKALNMLEYMQSIEKIAEDLKKFKSLGEKVSIKFPATISGHESIIIGNNIHIGENSFIRGEGGLSIGDNTHISRNLVLYTVNHNYKGERLPYDDSQIRKPVKIGKNVWIGMNVCIAPGTTIGDGVIIGMGATVSGDIENLSIIGSSPCRLLGKREKVHYDELDFTGSYGDSDGNPIVSDGTTKD